MLRSRAMMSTATAAVADATTAEINTAMAAAAAAFPIYSTAPPKQVAHLLESAASEIEQLGETLIHTAVSETGLLDTRIQGETVRTTGQLRQFAQLVTEGSWVDARLDVGGGTGRDIRRMLHPLGPATIFGASNFPLAFSVAGGDTAAALAARCPVVHKAHPGHPMTCDLIAGALKRAVYDSDLPVGVFSMVHGSAPRVGQELVAHPVSKVGGFTGSLQAGRALYDVACSRPVPIPFYAEMGSVNPVIILPGALGSKWESIASGLAGSVTMGAGQFCTNPGLVFTVNPSHDATMVSKFVKEVARAVDRIPPSKMLTENIGNEYVKKLTTLSNAAQGSVDFFTSREISVGGGAVLHVCGDTYLQHSHELQEEVFGPATLIVEFDTVDALLSAVDMLEGQLTTTVWGSSDDLRTAGKIGGLLQKLSNIAGRVLFNGFPTGVEVCSSMVHGGPYPASTIDETSVGTEAIRRFVRPVCFQDCPDKLLPTELRDANKFGIFRKVNGTFTRDSVKVDEYFQKQVV